MFNDCGARRPFGPSSSGSTFIPAASPLAQCGPIPPRLAEPRQLDPAAPEPALDQMVLIGHSMGGLVSRLQTYQSGDDYGDWSATSRFRRFMPTPEDAAKLRDMFFFEPSPSIRRVVTIATPFRGSKFSNQTTQWLLDKLIRLPERSSMPSIALPRQPQAFPGIALADRD